MDMAENSAMAHQEDVTDFIYYSAKNLTKPLKPDEVLPQGFREVELKKSKHFFNMEVNSSFSAVHVPTNVFDKGNILSDIRNNHVSRDNNIKIC